jgi:hypothetical protein
MNKILHTDTLGLAYTSYFEGNEHAFFTLLSPHFEPDDVAVAHFFRNFNSMPAIEQRAIEECYGKILDVGAGTGSHSVELQKRGFKLQHSTYHLSLQYYAKTRYNKSTV